MDRTDDGTTADSCEQQTSLETVVSFLGPEIPPTNEQVTGEPEPEPDSHECLSGTISLEPNTVMLIVGYYQ